MKLISDLKRNWLSKLESKSFSMRLLASFFVLAIILFSLAKFLAYNETRTGFSFTDPLLGLFKPVDVTWLTFVMIYLALVIALGSLIFHPTNFLIAIQSYTIVAGLRLLTIYLLPLNAPETIIPLSDPFVEFFGGGQTLYRDLFFSGHTSTMFLLFLTCTNKKLKPVFLVSTVFVGMCVLIQHVHYSIDVIAAPFFAYSAYRISILINPPLENN